MDKGGCILLSKDFKKVCLVYRKKRDDYSFPKGHMELGEDVETCAIRETEEETGRKCRLLSKEPIGIISYTNSEGNINTYMFLSVDEGPSTKEFKEEDKEVCVWVDFDKVEEKLSYQNLKDFWNEVKVKEKVKEIIKQ